MAIMQADRLTLHLTGRVVLALTLSAIEALVTATLVTVAVAAAGAHLVDARGTPAFVAVAEGAVHVLWGAPGQPTPSPEEDSLHFIVLQ